MALFCHAAAFLSLHPSVDVPELHQEFTIRRILRAIRASTADVGAARVVQLRPRLTGEEEGAPHAHRADRIELVGVEEDPCLDGIGSAVFAKTMMLDAVDDPIDEIYVDPIAAKEDARHSSSLLGMADRPEREILPMPADVVQQRGDGQDLQIGLLLSSNMERQRQNALGVVPAVARARTVKMGFGFLLNLLYDRKRRRSSHPRGLMNEKKITYKGRIITVYCERATLPNGEAVDLDIVRHPGAAAAVPVLDDGRFVLLRQYRYAAGGYLYEIPAGKLDHKEENPLACAQRELAEETGYRAERWEKLVSIRTTPGFSDEIIHLYLAEGLSDGPTAHEHDEVIELCLLTRQEIERAIDAGEITDAKTLVGLLAVFRRLDSHR